MEENLKSVIIFDPDTVTFDTSLPSLKYNRTYVGCAMFNSAMHDNREVVLAVGGLDGTLSPLAFRQVRGVRTFHPKLQTVSFVKSNLG